ncbi:hypothetical protein [Streptomyces sp. NPDC001276]|uniref:hypothetical protein n=1 Tax=unclassified Streptomyces TaxID=2593676 RepID=UPI0036CB42F0
MTGDTVTVVRAADGTQTHLVQDPQGRYTGFETHRSGSDTYVYPHDALPYVAAGLLDLNCSTSHGCWWTATTTRTATGSR